LPFFERCPKTQEINAYVKKIAEEIEEKPFVELTILLGNQFDKIIVKYQIEEQKDHEKIV
jgi:hypothetical protein